MGVDRSQVGQRSGGRRGWLWIPVTIGLLFIKGRAYAEVIHHRGALVAALVAVLAVSVLRVRLLAVAIFAGALFAVCVDPHPIVRAVVTGGAAFAVLLTAFLAISTVLHASQNRTDTRSPDVR